MSTQFIRYPESSGGGGVGTVTSVGLVMPSIFSIAGSPVTSAGSFTVTLATEVANTVFSGPTNGADATPTFRALVAADIPNLSAAKITSGQGTLSTSTTGVTVGTGSNSLLTNATINVQTATAGQPGLLAAADFVTFNSKQAAGSYITALTGDVTASGPGSSAATVAFVGGTAAATIATGAGLANAATSANTANAIVKRGASGEFSAGVISASLTGNVTGNVSGTALNVTGVVAIANGGTGQSTANDALNALLPSQTGKAGQVLQSDGTDAAWVQPVTAIYVQNTLQTIANITATTVNFDTVETDNYSAVTVGAGWEFECPADQGGTYAVQATVGWSANGSAGNRNIYMLKNGSIIAQSLILGSSAYNVSSWSNRSVVLAPTDTVTMQVYQDSGGNVDTLGTMVYTHVSIVKVN